MTDPIQTQSDARKKADEAWLWSLSGSTERLKHAVQAEITAHLEASIRDPETPLGHLYAMRDEDLQGQADMEERVARLEEREGDTVVAGAMAQLVHRAEHQATVIADLRKRLTEMQGWNVSEILKAAKDEPPVEETVDLRHRDYTVAAMEEREGNRLDHFERRLAVWHERLLAVEDHLRENGGFPPIDGEPEPAPQDPPGPELAHEGPCDGFGPGDTCAQCHDADGPELPEADGLWVTGPGAGQRWWSEATVRSLIERAEKAERLHNEADRQRDEWFSKYAEAERRLGELERTNLTLIAEKEEAERERYHHALNNLLALVWRDLGDCNAVDSAFAALAQNPEFGVTASFSERVNAFVPKEEDDA